ncbi:MAG: VWA domain-containing protein [Acidobacteriota bacterium]
MYRKARVPGGFAVRIAVCLAVLNLAAPAADEPFRVTLTSPHEGEVVAGVTRINADVLGGSGGEKVSFYVDGRLMFVDTTPPFFFDWDAGAKPSGKTIRVVASRPDGSSSDAQIHTLGIDSTEEVEVKLRQISVTVLDSNGEFVKDLDLGNFQVYEDGVRKQITNFYKGDAALSLILMKDMSRSMLSGLRIEKSKKAAIQFIQSLRPQDNLMVIAFNHGVYPLGDFTTERASLVQSIGKIVAGGGTCLYDTLIASCRKLDERHGRKVIVVFSDGRDEHSTAALDDATDALLKGDSTLYAVGLGLLGSEDGQRQILDDWSRQTGGRAFFADRVDDVSKFYAAISEELRWQYSLGYPPTPSKRRWHDIRVIVTGREGVRVRARTGYLSD